MTVVYIVSDSARAGKTALCASLARIIERPGNKVSVFKLVAAADATPETDPDVAIFNNLLDQPPLGWPIGQPNGDLTSTLLNKIKDFSDKAQMTNDVVIVINPQPRSAKRRANKQSLPREFEFAL